MPIMGLIHIAAYDLAKDQVNSHNWSPSHPSSLHVTSIVLYLIIHIATELHYIECKMHALCLQNKLTDNKLYWIILYDCN